MSRSKYDGFFKEGEQFGNWKIEMPVIKMDDRGRASVLCRCKCENVSLVACHHLVRGRTLRCKVCNNSYESKGFDANPHWKGEGMVPKTLLTRISSSAVQQHIPYNLTMEYVSTLYANSGQTCAYTGQHISTAPETSLSIKGYNVAPPSAEIVCYNKRAGYVEGNVAFVHKDAAAVVKYGINKTKDDFINMCLAVAKQHQFKNKQQVGGSNEGQESKASEED